MRRGPDAEVFSRAGPGGQVNFGRKIRVPRHDAGAVNSGVMASKTSAAFCFPQCFWNRAKFAAQRFVAEPAGVEERAIPVFGVGADGPAPPRAQHHAGPAVAVGVLRDHADHAVLVGVERGRERAGNQGELIFPQRQRVGGWRRFPRRPPVRRFDVLLVEQVEPEAVRRPVVLPPEDGGVDLAVGYAVVEPVEFVGGVPRPGVGDQRRRLAAQAVPVLEERDQLVQVDVEGEFGRPTSRASGTAKETPITSPARSTSGLPESPLPRSHSVRMTLVFIRSKMP